MNELAIPQEPYQTHLQGDWQPIVSLFTTYKEKFTIKSNQAKECYDLACEYYAALECKKTNQEHINSIYTSLTQKCKAYNIDISESPLSTFHRDLEFYRGRKENSIISQIAQSAYLKSTLGATYDHYKNAGQTTQRAIDATTRFGCLCAIIQHLGAYGISIKDANDDFEKFKEEVMALSKKSRDSKKSLDVQDYLVLDLAKTFYRGIYRLENWVIQYVYNSVCLHEQLAPAPTNSSFFNAQAQAIANILKPLLKDLATKKDLAKFGEDTEGYINASHRRGAKRTRDIKFRQCKKMWELSQDKKFKNAPALAKAVIDYSMQHWNTDEYKNERLFLYTDTQSQNRTLSELVRSFKAYCVDQKKPFPFETE